MPTRSRPRGVVHRCRLTGREHRWRMKTPQVIAQVAPDARQVPDHIDPVVPQRPRRPQSRQHEEMRRVHGARAHDHLAPGTGFETVAPALVGDAFGSVSACPHPMRQGIGLHREIVPAPRRIQVAARGAPAPPVADGGALRAEAFLPVSVAVRGTRVARLRARFDERCVERAVERAEPGAQGPPIAPVVVAAAREGLRPLEVGQHLAVGPPLRAHLGPMVEVERIAALVHQSVDRRRAAQDLAPGGIHAPPVQPGLRLAEVVPLEIGHGRDFAEGAGHVDPDAPVPSARLEQQHPRSGVLAQPIGENAPRGPGPDDDVVELRSGGHRPRPPRPTPPAALGAEHRVRARDFRPPLIAPSNRRPRTASDP